LAELLRPLRLGLRYARNLRRSTRKAPDYVYFRLEGALPLLRQPSTAWWRRFVTKESLSLEELAERFLRIAAHKGIRGVVLHLRELVLTAAQLEALQERLDSLR